MQCREFGEGGGSFLYVEYVIGYFCIALYGRGSSVGCRLVIIMYTVICPYSMEDIKSHFSLLEGLY